jgi:hypothetical protein
MEQNKRYRFATHDLKIDCVAQTGNEKRVSLQCTCCEPPKDFYIECLEDDLEFLVNTGQITVVEGINHDKKNRKKNLDCIFGEPQQEDRSKKKTRLVPKRKSSKKKTASR